MTNMLSRLLSPELSVRTKRITWPQVPCRHSSLIEESARTDDLVPTVSELPAKAQATPDLPDLDLIRKQAYEQGVSDGRAVSQEQAAAAQLQPVLERLSNMIGSLAAQRVKMRQESEADLVRLSITIARRILNRELTIDPMSVQGLIKAAIGKLDRGEAAHIRVSPDQFPTVQLCVGRLHLAAPLEVIADSSLGAGTIFFQTTKGTVDASLETQLLEIERGFADRLRS